MNRLAFAALSLFIGAASLCDTATAQVNPNLEIGLKPYGAYDSTDFDSVDVANGNAFVHIPLISYPQRGSLTEKLYMVANGKNFYVSQVCNSRLGTCTSSWRWGNNPNVIGPPQGPGPGVSIVDRNFQWVHWQLVSPNNWATVYTWDGGSHQMAQLTDGSGDLEPFDGSVLRYKNSNGVIIDSSGNSFGFGSTDPNGNYFSIVTGPPSAEYDTMGRNLLTLSGGASTTDYTGCAGALPTTSASIGSGPGPNGGTLQIKFCYANGALKTNFHAYDYDPYADKDLIQEVQGTAQFLQTVITYDGNSWSTSPKWTFAFDAGVPGDTNVHYGDLLTVTLPTGGTISYAWSTKTFCGTRPALIPVSRIVTSRTVNANDGLGNLTTTYASGGIVTDPMGNDTVHVITALGNTCSLYETEVDSYQGSHSAGTLLKKVLTNYQYQTNPFDHIGDGTTSTATNVYPTQITTIWPNGQQSQVQMVYDANLIATAPAVAGTASYTMSYGNLTEEREYDYGSGGSGPLLRRKDYTYLAFNNSSYKTANMLGRVASETVYNGTGTQVAQTTYGYDEYGLQTTSTPEHGAPPFSVRGNRTSVKRWLNTTGGTLNTTTTYFDTGMPYQVTDPKVNVTTYTYSGTYDGAYVTQTAMPATGSVQHVVSATYDFNTGKMATFTDQNGQPFSYGYDALWRPTSASYPDTGQTTLSYPTLTEIVTTEKMATSQNKVSTLIFDGLGRTKQAQLNSDPDGIDYTDTTYDGDGRIHTVSNPYRSTGDPTYGITTHLYDPLNRGCLVAPPDATPPSGSACPGSQPSNTIFTVYSGNSTTVTDEQGKTRESFTDGLGRLTSVIENPGGLNYTTTYGYDALDNLTSVVQNSSRNRTFVYDSLSRLTSATNPESGTTSYAYDSDSNVLTRIDARSITATFSYDALNRLASKTYSDGTPGAYFYYDQTNVNWGFPLTNTTGRLSSIGTWYNNGWQTSSVYSYDPMGRTAIAGQYFNGTGFIAFVPTYSYNLIGGVTSYCNGAGVSGAGVTFTQSFNTAGLPTQLTSSWSDSQHPATLASGAHYNGAGGVTSYLLGNNLTETAAYNGRVQPCRMNVNSSGTVLSLCTASVPSGNVLDLTAGFNYGSADNGDVMSWAAAGQQTFSRNYTYDGVNRVATMSAPGSTCSGLSWTYDGWGNRTDQTAAGGTCNTFHQSVDGNNRLSGSPYQYDAAGNMTHDASHSYTYDAEGRITQVDGGSTATYLYDATGHRVEKTVGGVTTGYLYDIAGNVSAEMQGTTMTAGYIFLTGQLLAEYKNGTTYFAHGDHLGSTRLLTGYPTASVVECDDYYPFGELISCGGTSTTTHKFTGKERDSESNLDNFGARYDSSAMGRFMSPDAGRFLWPDPQSLNRYAYTRNSPLKYVDPSGEYFIVASDAIPQARQYISTLLRSSSGRNFVSNIEKSKLPNKVDAGRLPRTHDGSGWHITNAQTTVQSGSQPGSNGGTNTTIDPVNILFQASLPGQNSAFAIGLNAFAHDSFHVSDANAQPTLAGAAAASASGDAPSKPGADDTTGGTAQARADALTSGLGADASNYTPNAETDQEADQIIAYGQAMQMSQSALSSAEVQTPSVEGVQKPDSE